MKNTPVSKSITVYAILTALTFALFSITLFKGARAYSIFNGAVTRRSSGPSAGQFPSATFEGISSQGLIQAPDGSLYWTSFSQDSSTGMSFGVLLRSTVAGDVQTVHIFSESDGAKPSGRLLMASDGFIYGTTIDGGDHNAGVLYRVHPDGSSFQVLHSFDGASASDGAHPLGGVIEDGFRNIYGTASQARAGNGVIFSLNSYGDFRVLHILTGAEGSAPASELLLGQDGFLYGSASRGGHRGNGTLFRLWTDGSSFQVLHSFAGTDGAHPQCALLQTAEGKLVGATKDGGDANNGILFELEPDGSAFRVLHSFTGYNSNDPASSDGAKPLSALAASEGYLYGTTLRGGRLDSGAVYKLDPRTGDVSIVFSYGGQGRDPVTGLLVNGGDIYLPSLTAKSGKKAAAFGLESLTSASYTQSALAALITPQAIDTVTTTADTGAGSLRAVIAAAAAGDTINFSVTGTITLTSGEILINKNLTITGPGSGSLTVSGNNASRIFFISSGTVSISGLTIANGLARGGDGGAADRSGGAGGGAAGMGGGIFCNGGSLTLTDVTFSGDQATGGNGGVLGSDQLFGGGGGGGIGGAGGATTQFTGGTGGNGGNLGGPGGAQDQPGGPGAGGGGGDGSFDSAPGGVGGFGGGGGGGGIFAGSGTAGAGGNGGFGGGGGGGGFGDGISPAGTGGTFGGNGGGGATSGGIVGGRAGGGGGAGLGGGLFVRQGSITIVSATFNNDVATGGATTDFSGGNNGQGKGGGLFINSGVTGSIATINYSGNSASDAGTTATDNNNIWGGFACTAATPSITAPSSACPNSTGNTASGPAGESSYSWTITGGTITAGAASQTVTFTAGASGTISLTLNITDTNGCTASNNASVSIGGTSVTVGPSTLAAGTAGVAYTATQFTPTGSTFAITTGTLPAGMTLSTSGLLSGTPTQTGSFPITVTATPSSGCPGSVSVTLTINCPTITVSPSTLSAGTAGTAYTTTQFTQTGGVGTVTFSRTGTLPTGMTFTSAGVLSGTPTKTGSFPLTIKATDSNGCTGSISVTLGINCQTITVSPSTVPSGTAGTAYTSTTFSQTGGIGATTFSRSGTLPTGMTFNTGTHVLSGTPTQTGSFPITITATDSNGCTGSVSVTIVINCQTITVGPSTIPTGTTGTAYTSTTFTQTGGIGTVTFSESGTLPTGMSFNTGTHVLSGTPTQSGSFPITITATDGNSCTGSKSYTLTINCPTITVGPGTIPPGTAGTAYTSTTFTQTGGTGSITFTETGALPTGMTLTTAGVLSGTPTKTGSFPITVTATDANGCTGSKSYTLTISCGTVTVGPTSIPSGTAGVLYTSTTFTQTGGVGTITFSESGALPTGLTFSSAGVLSGTPLQTGSFPITVTATDSNGCTGTKAYTIVIACPTITVNPVTISSGVAGATYPTTTFSQVGGVGTVTFSESGALPTGLTFVAGVLSGAPTQTGTFPITVTATDSNACTGSRSYTLVIACPAITVSPSFLPVGTAGVAYPATTFTQTGGLGTVTFSESGLLPTGITFVGGVLSGTPTQTGTFPITVTATDSNGCTGSVSLNLAVNCQTITLAPTSIPIATVNTPYSAVTFTQAGGIGSVTFFGPGTLPAGMSFSNGVLSGTPTQTGVFSITITATDSNGCTTSETLGLAVACSSSTITVTPGTVSSGSVNTAYSPVTFNASGGTGPYTIVEAGALPTGMTFSNGVLSGTPTQTGVFPFSVMAQDANGCGGITNYLLAIACGSSPITIAPGALSPGTAGTLYPDVTFSASGGSGSYSLTFAGALPAGMSWVGGVLSGTPTESGTFEFTVAALDSSGCAGSTGYTLTIACPTITISPSSLSAGTAGVAYGPVTFTQTGGVGTVTFTESGALPNGVTFSSGVLSGTPTQTGSFPITVTATDSDQCSATAIYTLVIGCPTITVNPATLPSGTAGVAYTTTTFTQTGGVGSVTFTESGALPTGLTFANGVLSGTPTQTGSFPITITATDANGCTGSRSYTLSIACPAITVAPSTVAAGTAGSVYSSTTFTQTGGVGTVTFSESGALPTGMTFVNGVLSGTPTQTGAFPITVTATDQNACQGTVSVTLTINCPTITVSPSSIPAGTAGTAYTNTPFTEVGAVGATTFSESGALPAGMMFSGGALSGTPTQTGSFPITITATDKNGCTGSRGYTLVINCPTITVNPGTVSPAIQFEPAIPTQFTQTGGVGTVTYSTKSTLPTGMTLSSGGLLSGTPAQGGSFSITVVATDTNGCTGSRTVTLLVTMLDKCLKDNASGNYVQFNSATGNYLFTICGPNGFTMAGVGTITMVNSVINIADNKSDRQVTIQYNTAQLTGRGLLVRILTGGTTMRYPITDTNPHPVCVCGG